MFRRTHIFVDGENLVFRYQELLRSGKVALPTVQHIPDIAVWSNSLYAGAAADIQRIAYYTSCVGDDDYLGAVHDCIQSWSYSYTAGNLSGTGRLTPRVFKKEAKTQKSRRVDIHVTLDSLVSAYTHEIDQIIILTGDSDFIAVIEQIMRQGKQVIVGSFSSGLHPKLRRAPDHFFLLDRHFVKDAEPNQSPEPTPTAGTSAAEQPLVPAAVVAHL